MPPKKIIESNIYFGTADGEHLIKLEDIPAIEFTAEDEELCRHFPDDTFEMTFTITDECMNALMETTAPARNLVEKIKNAFGEYFAEVSECTNTA